MPVGVIVDALAVVIGGIVGAVVGKKLKKDFIDNMNLILGCCSMCMGVSTIVLMQHMPAVVFAIILGTGLGLAVHFGKHQQGRTCAAERHQSFCKNLFRCVGSRV